MRLIRLIAGRELREIGRDVNLLIPLFLLPCLMGILAGSSALVPPQGTPSGAAVTDTLLDQIPTAALSRFTTPAALPEVGQPAVFDRPDPLQTLLKALSIPLFWIIAAVLTPALAADSFVGERERNTIEPLLASPARKHELIGGKLLGAIIPPILGAWLGTAVYAAIVAYTGSPNHPRFVLADSDWLFSTFVIVPLVAIFGGGVSAIVSARVSSYRVAYQLSGLIVLPIVLFAIPQTVLLYLLTPRAYIYIGIVVAVLDVLLLNWVLRSTTRYRLLGKG